MRDAIVIFSGGADVALDDLDGLTPLQTATTPNLDRLAQLGRVGTARHIPHGFAPVREISALSLFSFDPARWPIAQGTCLAQAEGIAPGDDEWCVCIGAVTIDQSGRLVDPLGGKLSQAEMRALLVTLAETLRERPSELPDAEGLSFHALRDGRGLGVCRDAVDFGRCDLTEPELIVGKPAARHTPKGGPAGALLRAMHDLSAHTIAEHEVTALRRELGERLPTHLWFWGAAAGRERRAQRPDFTRAQGVSAVLAARACSVMGLAALCGIDVIDDREWFGEPVTAWPAMIRDALTHAQQRDLLVVYLDVFEELSHDGDPTGKVAAIETADRCVVGPLLEHIGCESGAVGRIMVTCDHIVHGLHGRHTGDAVPFVMAGDDVVCISHQETFDEVVAAQSDLHVEHGADLMEYFLYSGRRGVPGRSTTIQR